MNDALINSATRVNLGCGNDRMDGFLNVDVVPGIKPDLVHDLNRFPYPFRESQFEHVIAKDVIEHLEDMPAFMREVWRVLKPGGLLTMTTPHFSNRNSYTDPTHRRHLGFGSFDYFVAGHKWNFYGSTGFEIRHRAIVFEPSLANKVVARLANRWPARYEERWAWIFPAWFLYVEMVARKDGAAGSGLR